MPRLGCLLLGAVLTALALGCTGGRKAENIDVQAANDPLAQPRTILERYAKGEPLGSEVSSFPFMVEEVRKVDKDRADILEKGFAEIQKAPSTRAATARELLKKLAPSQT